MSGMVSDDDADFDGFIELGFPFYSRAFLELDISTSRFGIN
ncbi:hypothetical protein AALP_AAs58799U000100 [Arabis alpina]|uniref:Uncharacterized protein n=1 Tax=Arabis alpina TaxID=50452 RepID=A0A087FZX2_ARAAL|nr:hypothetical protein AALP_AAs58799U000100 [Arabis alpina]